jgi:3-oxoacyl-[acyl-carrier protein] reductase
MTIMVRAFEREKELVGKVAVVTGSSRNIGRAIALALASAGAAVIVNARVSTDEASTVANEIEQRGGHAIVHLADVTQQRQAEGLIEKAVRTFGRLDMMVCNVGSRLDCPFGETSYDAFRDVLDKTAGASFLCCKAALPHLIAAGGGAIVMVGGIGGHVGTIDRSAVSAGKAAVAGLTRALAMELGPKRITVNCVAPGLIDTTGRVSVPTHLQRLNPLNRRGTPDELAAIVRMLCGPGGRYVTGQTIHVNGGLLMAG